MAVVVRSFAVRAELGSTAIHIILIISKQLNRSAINFVRARATF
jgi:hypothetical protein